MLSPNWVCAASPTCTPVASKDLTISFPQHQRQCAFLEVLIDTLRSFEAPRVRAASRG